MTKPVMAYLGLGSNMGDRQRNLSQALALLSEKNTIDVVSSIYETEPWGYLKQPPFLNAACRTTTELGPRALLSLAKDVEARMGRTLSFQNAPRPIDIDILLYDNEIIVEPGLCVPHPGLKDRAFVLVPLAEIAPEVVHPQEGKTIRALADQVEGRNTVRPYTHPHQPQEGRLRTDV